MRAERGFTLVELLVAMTILGLISLAVLASLRFGAAAWQRSTGRDGSVEQIELAETVLRRALVQAYPYLSASDPTDPHLLFEGAPGRIRFLAPAPEALGGAGLAWFTLATEAHDGGLRLVIGAAPELTRPSGVAERPSVLIDGLAQAGFSYFGTDESGSAPSWRDSWTNRLALPSLIRISGRFPPGDGRHWPELIVAPQVAVDEGCVLDLLSHRCQGR